MWSSTSFRPTAGASRRRPAPGRGGTDSGTPAPRRPDMTRENVIADKLYVPFDIEKKIGMPEGDFSHGRPGSFALGVPRAYVYRTEVEGLYMCGASAGGGGVSAAPGYNAF